VDAQVGILEIGGDKDKVLEEGLPEVERTYIKYLSIKASLLFSHYCQTSLIKYKLLIGKHCSGFLQRLSQVTPFCSIVESKKSTNIVTYN